MAEETQKSAQAKIKLMPKNIIEKDQNVHIIDTVEYKARQIEQKNEGKFGPSFIYGGINEAQELVNRYAGTGEADIRKGRWTNKEKIKTDSVIGVVVNNLDGTLQLTANLKIHYANGGTHIVPDYDKRRRGIKP